MKLMHRTLTAAAAAALLALPATSAMAVTGISGTTVSGTRGVVPLTPGIDYIVQAELSPGVLTPTMAGTVQDVMGGNKAAPGGHVELFADSESGTYANPNVGGAFQTQTPTVLSGNLPRGAVQARSLNGNDWFQTGGGHDNSYGAANRANFWFQDFSNNTNLDAVIAALPAPLQPIAKQTLYENFRDGGGFARLSDPNVAYINEHDNGEVRVGLAANYDMSPEVRQTLGALEASNPLIPTGTLTNLFDSLQASGDVADPFQFSEVVIVTIDGQEYFLYGFEADPSGLVAFDPTESYDGIYEFIIPGFGVIPEPLTATLGMMAMGALGLTATRRQRG